MSKLQSPNGQKESAMKSKSKMTNFFVGSLAAIALVLMMLLPQLVGAQGATFTVNSTADTVDINPGDGVCADGSGNCTLRAAIMEANALPGADTITLPAGTYTLTIPGVNEDFDATGDLDIASDLTITGAGANMTTIDGGGIDRVLEIRPVNTTNVHISGLTVTGGKTLNSSPGGGAGGGIKTQGTLLTLTNVTVDHNEADYGAGIEVDGPTTLNSSTVSNNSASYGPGGIDNYINGPLTLNNSTVSGNSGGFGGAIGGSNHGNTLILNNSTLSGNISPRGALYVPAGTVIMKNTILADNGGGSVTFQGAYPSALISLGNNLSTDNFCSPSYISLYGGVVSGGLDQPTDLNNTPALLAPLALNLPGTTKTHALLPGSPAIDAGGDCLPTDQRGVPRPQGAACDIGAYEVGGACAPPPPNMVAWWPLDEGSGATSFQDIIGGNNATPFASPVGAAQGPQPVSGKVGGAMQFPKFGNGLSGARVSPQGALVNIGAADFTIDAWVQVPPASANRLHYLVNKFDATQNKGYALYVVSPGVPGNERLEFKWGDGTNVSTVQTNSSLTTGQWHHVAVTFARNVGGFALDIRLYLDGAQQGQQTENPPGLGSLVNFLVLEIGWQPGTIDEPITIDELEIFNRALTGAEIQSIYNAGSAGKCLPQPCPPTINCPGNIVVDNSNHPGQCSAVVNYTVSATASCSSVTVGCSPPSDSVFPKGTTTVNCAATNPDGTAACSFTVTVIPPQLTALSPARVWVGLKTSDDVGTKFDLLAEVLKNGAVVGTGQVNGVPGGSSGFNNAVLNTITLALSSLPVDICPGDALGFKLSVRVAANSGHSSGTARLWYSGKFIDTGASRDAGSRFGATIGGGTADYFLRTGVLDTTAGSSKTFIDVLVNRNVGGNPFKPFGAWSITF